MDHRFKCKIQNYKAPRRYIGKNLDDLGYGDDFLDETSKVQSMKEIMDKLGFTRIKNICPVKNNVKRMRKQAIDWEKIFAKVISDRGPLLKIYRKLKAQEEENKHIQLKNGPNSKDTSKKKIHNGK